MEYFHSSDIVKNFSVSCSNNIVMFARQLVLPYKKYFTYYQKNCMHHKGEYINIPLVNIDRGLEHLSISTLSIYTRLFELALSSLSFKL